MERINLEEYQYAGEGANGMSYVSRTNPGEMLKIYNTTFPVEKISVELESARKLYRLGVPTPEPGELVTDGERIGIRFQRIAGKRSYSRMFADEPERTDELAREMAGYCKYLHSIPAPEGMFTSAREQYLQMLKADRTMTGEEHRKMEYFIQNMPETRTLLQGDMHFGNIISTLPKGAPLTEPHNVYFIDLESVAYGHPFCDLGMMMCICLLSDEEFRVHDFHVDGRQTRLIWESFIDEYFFAEDRLADKLIGPGQTPGSVEKAIVPFACVKFLLVGSNLNGIIPPHYYDFLRKNLLGVMPSVG